MERAAKALGWRVTAYSERRTTGVVDGGMAVVVADGRTFGWSPLHNDGDALRLALSLRLDLNFWPSQVYAGVRGKQTAVEQDITGDVAAATRRAIVRAASEICPTNGS